jgi:diguanylate cyclase (GGDEF)-like protein
VVVVATRSLRPGLPEGLTQREVAVPAVALGVGLVLYLVGARLGAAPMVPVYAPLVDMAIVIGLLVVAVVAGMDVLARREGRSLPMVAVALAAAVMWVPHMFSFPLALPALGGHASHAQTASVILDVVQIAIPALLVVAFLQPLAEIPDPARALRRTCFEATGFGLVCAGSAFLVAPILPPLVDGLRYTSIHTALQVASLLPTIAAIVVFLMGHRADRRVELSLVATLILLSFGELTGIADTSLFDGRWYLSNLFRFLPVAALMAGQLTLYADVVAVERRRVRHLDLIHRITGELVGGRDIDDVLGEVASSAVDLVSGLRGVAGARAVLLRLEDGLATQLAGSQTRAGSVAVAPFRASGSALLSAALRSGGAAEARLPGRPAEAADPLVGPGASWVAYSLVRVRGGVVGALGVVTERQPARDAEVLPLLQGIADLAGIAIRNAQDYRTVTDRGIDLLTGLANRHQFERVLGQVDADEVSVLSIDIDDLQTVNNEYGHAAGDQVLQAVARVLAQCVRGRDLVARVGGDEFAALLPGAGASEAAVVAQRILDTLRGVEVPYGARQLTIGCATGGAETDPVEVMGRADEALYRARKLGPGRIESADRVRPAPGGRASDWDGVLRGMLRDGGVRAVFQPIVDLSSGELHGFEALARPEGLGAHGSVENLFAAALRLGLGIDLDWFCRRAALDGSRQLPDPATLFINVTVAGLLDPLHGVDQTLMLLDWAGRKPTEVVLELSEREPVADKVRLAEVLASYREAGLRFALDDVGEGHSTFEILAISAPEFVKVARSLVAGAGSNPAARAVIESLVTFARASGALVIAEGLETPADVRAMTSLGVDLGQGYGLGRPEAPEVAALSVPGARQAASEATWQRWMQDEGVPGPGTTTGSDALDPVPQAGRTASPASFSITRTLAEAASVQAGLIGALEVIGRAMGWRVGEAWMSGGLRSTRSAAWAEDESLARDFLAAGEGVRLEPGQWLPGRVWGEAVPVALDGPDLARLDRAQLSQDGGLDAALGFPVLRDDEVVGVLCFYGPRARSLDHGLHVALANAARELALFLAHREAVAESEVLLHQLRERGRQLEDANRLKSEFLATVSHELRTPVSIVLAYADMLGAPGALPPDQQSAAIAEINRAGARLALLIDDILEYSQLRAGEVAARTETVDVLAVVEDVALELMVAASAKGLHLRTRRPPGPLVVRADPAHLRHVLTQLVSNALKFTDEGGVAVSVEPRGADALVTVEDSGIGIPAADLENIFQHFRQVDQTMSRPHGGAGLGLAIARSLVEMQGGRMGVDSSPGEGTRMWFTLPLQR